MPVEFVHYLLDLHFGGVIANGLELAFVARAAAVASHREVGHGEPVFVGDARACVHGLGGASHELHVHHRLGVGVWPLVGFEKVEVPIVLVLDHVPEYVCGFDVVGEVLAQK